MGIGWGFNVGRLRLRFYSRFPHSAPPVRAPSKKERRALRERSAHQYADTEAYIAALEGRDVDLDALEGRPVADKIREHQARQAKLQAIYAEIERTNQRRSSGDEGAGDEGTGKI